MKKIGWMVLFVFLFAALSACNGETEKAEKKVEEPKVPQMLEAQLEVPETADVNGKVEMKATVTQGDENVADADKVEFEVWEEGKEAESKMIKAKNNKDGTYEAETTFDHDGVFTVQVHVTARGLHTMPKKSVTVGAGAAQKETEHEHGEEHHDHGHGEHAQGFGMHFVKPDNAKAGTDTTMTVQLQMDEAPLEKAQVRYEIWNDDISDKHEWIDAEESSPGEYTAAYTFTEAGTFNVQIHVENKDGLHEHEEHQIEVEK
ncbi:hypothetical protein F9802_18580 [Bacillus aerolatus]|uniref:YtkA-like domain-containing protein n=1 Tax=Bacillus aerolatus TaxID=2653354 RepID=A0A6I1FKP7_9BACI|nr:FixH family protein [Bacillus aerolatus]KAB7704203.1 hypothetical protein F9802_18580 [Bacillus aerolatus]